MPVIPVLSKLLHDDDVEVLKNSLWTLAFLGINRLSIARKFIVEFILFFELMVLMIEFRE